MRAARATLAVAITTLLTGAAAAHAAPAAVDVRIEGATSTIFDRAVQTDGHPVKASSDADAHQCDGTNHGRSAVAGPTATAAAVDALATLGQHFDGQWYPGFDDYYVTQLGPEREDNDALRWWGLIVDRVFSPLGGCQRQVHAGDEVLWAYDAFSNRQFLWLAAPATAQLGAPLNVTVSSTASSTSNAATSGPPYAGALVGAVDANGQPAPAGTADAATSGADGIAAVVFHTGGWQRVKARTPGTYPTAIASNSVDVCVEATPGAGCAGTPPSQQPLPPGKTDPGKPISPAGGDDHPGKRPQTVTPVWTRRFARGTLRDDRARGLRWHGSWTRTLATSAWHGTLTRGVAGARVALELGAGRPAFALRTAGGRSRVEIRAAGRTQAFTLAASRAPQIQRLVGRRRVHRGTVTLRVLAGAVYLDGVGRAS